jgi:hypothetical protein
LVAISVASGDRSCTKEAANKRTASQPETFSSQRRVNVWENLHPPAQGKIAASASPARVIGPKVVPSSCCKNGEAEQQQKDQQEEEPIPGRGCREREREKRKRIVWRRKEMLLGTLETACMTWLPQSAVSDCSFRNRRASPRRPLTV